MRTAIRRRLTLGVATLVTCAAAAVGITTLAHAATASATFTKTGDWGTGHGGSVAITNTGTAPLNWTLEFTLPADVSISGWDVQLTRNGDRYTAKAPSWAGALAPGATYTWGYNGSGPYRAPTSCTLNGDSCGGGGPSVPGTPGTPTITGVTASSISLSWSASSGTVTGYRVYEGNDVRATVTGTSATVSGLAAGSTHTYTVAAYNTAGESPKSATVTGSTTTGPGVPPAPENLRVTGTSDSSISLAWNPVTGSVVGYRVYEGNDLRATVNGTSTTISGLAACTGKTYTVAAYNSVGESPRSSTVSGSTTGCPQSELPKHFLTGYWQNFKNPAPALKLRDTPAEYDLIAVAFADATSTPGALSFTLDPGLASAVGGYTDAEFKSDIATVKSRGKKVILSVGGELGRVTVADSASATNFANSMHSLIQAYGFDGVDIDLENGLNPTYMGQALRSLRQKVGPSLIITMAPQTIDMYNTSGSYFQLALNIKDIVTVVHTQYYNSGSMPGCDNNQAYSQGTVNFIVALACTALENGLRPDQVSLGLPAGAGAAGGGVVAPSVVNQALDCLAKGTNCGSFKPPRTYPGIRGAMTWSINWDAQHSWAFSKTVRPHLNTLP